MNKCDGCRARKEIARLLDLHWHGEKDCPYECPITTNADSIRAMTDEELADVFDHVQGDAYLVGIGQRKNSLYPGACISWLDWLQQEVASDG